MPTHAAPSAGPARGRGAEIVPPEETCGLVCLEPLLHDNGPVLSLECVTKHHAHGWRMPDPKVSPALCPALPFILP